MLIRLYATLDTTSKVFDDIPFMGFDILPPSNVLLRISFTVADVFGFRIGALSEGSTDTYAVGGDFRLRTT